jgi:hypothetical protein
MTPEPEMQPTDARTFVCDASTVPVLFEPEMNNSFPEHPASASQAVADIGNSELYGSPASETSVRAFEVHLS